MEEMNLDSVKRAVFPGSFDPITRGHENILRRAAGLFDEVIVAIGVNQDKRSMFSAEQRIAWCEATFADLDNVRVDQFEGLTAEYCQSCLLYTSPSPRD